MEMDLGEEYEEEEVKEAEGNERGGRSIRSDP